MKTFFTIFLVGFTLILNIGFAQRVVETSRNPMINPNSNRPRPTNNQNSNTNSAVILGSNGDCYFEEQTWVDGYWVTDDWGRKVWRPGAWVTKQTPAPCPPPNNLPPPPPPMVGCVAPSMSPMDFSTAMNSINALSFESTKLSMAKQIISANCVTSAQVLDMLRLFSFESSKLDLAKFAYPKACDPNMYFIVNNAFSFSSSVDDLNYYIQSLPPRGY